MSYVLKDVLLKVDGVSLSLGGRPVLRGVDFEVRDIVREGCITGQVVGLLGPSGVGKTQLFRVLAGLQQPDGGSVRITGEQLPVRLGDVGVVAQDYPLFEHHTVMGNLLVARGALARPLARERARGLLERFELGALAARFPAQLSGGQRQRVAIAQQFMCSDHYLLMDEPFSGLDPVAVDRVCALITEVASQDELNTVVLATHDIGTALALCDQVLLLGRERDADGATVPGARVVARWDLAALGLAWRPGLRADPELLRLEAEVRSWFPRL